jgi:hypothetical protein
MMRITWRGLDEFQQELDQATREVTRDVAAELYRQGEAIMTDSQRHYVPVDQGTLRGSGHVKQPDIRGTRVSVTLGYGGAASAYALIQHEAMHFAHTVGGPKYLERPVNASARKVAQAIDAVIEKSLT